MNKYAKGELALKILYILSVGVMIPAAIVAPNIPKAMNPLLRELAKRIDAQPRTVHNSLVSLKRKKLIAFSRKKGKLVATISVDGKNRLSKGNLRTLSIKQSKKWDGKYRIVIFDIPEKQKRARDSVRTTLHRLGFLQIQKSCFVHPFECQNEIDVVSVFFDVTEYITYIVAESVEGEHEIRQHFQI